MKLLFVFVIFAICFVGTLSLSCLQCIPDNCLPIKTECNYGVGSDICGCCDQCLKGPGDRCGGPWNSHGQCGSELVCQFDKTYYNEHFFHHVGNQPAGVCGYEQEDDQEEQDTSSQEQDTPFRVKRRSGRRRGSSLIKAKTHSHTAFGKIPPHILAALRKAGYKV